MIVIFFRKKMSSGDSRFIHASDCEVRSVDGY